MIVRERQTGQDIEHQGILITQSRSITTSKRQGYRKKLILRRKKQITSIHVYIRGHLDIRLQKKSIAIIFLTDGAICQISRITDLNLHIIIGYFCHLRSRNTE